jgi:heat shock protein HtpX
MANINDFSQSSANWRDTIRRNRHRSYLVMATYVVIYICLGLLIDTYLYSRGNQLPLSVIFKQIITLHWFPYITLITTGVAAISLLVTFAFANKLMLLGTQYHEVVPGKTRNPEELQLYNVVEEMKIAAGMKFMPKVYIIEADYMNAFASGWSEKSAMVAITRGLMQKLSRAELQAVMAHELTHIRHQDIKLTLCASVLSQLILMIIDIMFYATLFGSSDRDSNRNAGWLFIVIMVLRFVLPLITVLLMLYLSRKREFMADAGAVQLMRDNQPMAHALCKIAQDHEANHERYSRAYQRNGHEQVRQQAYIFDPGKAGIKANNSFTDAFSTHPSIKRRLQALGFREK